MARIDVVIVDVSAGFNPLAALGISEHMSSAEYARAVRDAKRIADAGDGVATIIVRRRPGIGVSNFDADYHATRWDADEDDTSDEPYVMVVEGGAL